MAELKIRRCDSCRVKFKPKAQKQKCCSISCRSRMRVRRVEGNCLICGKGYSSKPSLGQTVCSKSCAGKMTWLVHPEMKEMLRSPERRKALKQGFESFLQTPAGKAWEAKNTRRMTETSPSREPDFKEKMHAASGYRAAMRKLRKRMLTNNPSKDPEVIAKMKVTKEKKGILHKWLGTHHNRSITPQEQKVFDLLGGAKSGWKLDHVISTGHPRKCPSGYPAVYRLDVCHPELKLVVEVDGKGHRLSKRMLLDAKRTRKLEELGWSVFRVTNEDVTTRPSLVLLRIKTAFGASWCSTTSK